MSDVHHVPLCDILGITVNELLGGGGTYKSGFPSAPSTIVSSCVCVIIPNLTRGVRPYAFVENVVTRADARGHGYATACLNHAKALAQQAGCYKMMLLTGSHDPKTLDFYRHAGYSSTDKTAFIQWL